MADFDTTAVSGVEVRGYRRGSAGTDSWDQYVIPVMDRIVSFDGRMNTFRTPGRAATTQKIAALHNATGSGVIVAVQRIKVDVLITAVKAVTIKPPMIRIHRFTAVPTNGTALAKVGLDTTQTSSTSVTAWGDASADGTGSGTTLTITIPGSSMISQTCGPRIFTAVGYEEIDAATYLYGEPEIILRPLEGCVVYLDDAVVTTGNPATDFWNVTMDWQEYTRP